MIKQRHYRIINCLILIAFGYLSVPCMIQVAGASPVDTTYRAALNIPILDDPGEVGNLRDDVPFNGDQDDFPNDIGPGKDLSITERFSRETASGQETIVISIFGPGGEGNHSSLTDSEIDSEQPTFLEVTDLYWEDATVGFDVIDIALLRSFDGGSDFNEIVDFDSEANGNGTEALPLNIYFEFSAEEITRALEPSGFENATDLNMELTVKPVPIPGSLLMLMSGLLSLLVANRKFRASSGKYR